MSAFSNTFVGTPLSGSVRVLRSLGDNRVAPRRLYFIDFPLLLSITGVLAWMMPTDTMLFVSSSIAGIVGVYTLWTLAIRRGPIRFSHLVCLANTVGYGAGAMNSWLSIHRGSMDLAAFFGKDTNAVTHAMAAILFSSGLLYSLGEIYETPLFGDDFRLAFDSRMSILIFFGTALMAVGYKMGVFGYMGLSSSGGHESLVGSLISWLYPPLFAVTVTASLNWRGRLMRWLFGMIALIQFVMIIPTGRRNLLYSILLALIATRFGSYRPKWSLPRKAIYAILLTGVLSVGATAFYYLRYAAFSAHRSVTIGERLELALQIYESGNTSKVNQSLQDNLQKRTFVLGYLSDLLEASGRMTPAMGANAIHEFEITIPSAFWSNKSSILYQEETVANMQFHFSFVDEANSTLTAGALDFGLWGIILYPIVLCGLLRAFSGMVGFVLPTMASSFVILALIFNSLMTEVGLWLHLVAIRDGLIFSFILWALSKLPKIALRHPSTPAGVIYR
jgi:hypothetical protein